jgi:signal transduction histidine kinase
MTSATPREDLPAPPFAPLRERLAALAKDLRTGGSDAHARSLEDVAGAWWKEQEAWNAALDLRLRAAHEINNALVAVKGNAQILLLGSWGSDPEARPRLETIIREAGRISEIAGRLREFRHRMEGTEGRRVA